MDAKSGRNGASAYTLSDLRRALELLPPGSAVTLPRDVLLAALPEIGDGPSSPLPEPPDRLLTAREVATRLGVSAKYVYHHSDDYPFMRRVGKKAIRFSERGLERWLARK